MGPAPTVLEGEVIIPGLSEESFLRLFLYIISNISIDATNKNADMLIVLGFFRKRESIGEIWRDRQREKEAEIYYKKLTCATMEAQKCPDLLSAGNPGDLVVLGQVQRPKDQE